MRSLRLQPSPSHPSWDDEQVESTVHLMSDFAPASRRRASHPDGAGAARESLADTPDRSGARPALGMMTLNKVVVSAYKVMGFAILTTILVGLASYIATNLFYYVNRSWIAPTVLSTTDPHVLQLDSQYASESAHRDALVAQRLDLGARLSDSVRVAAAEEDFQRGFARAMDADFKDRSSELAMFASLLRTYAATKGDIQSSSAAYSDMSKGRIREQFDARLIDHDQMISGTFQLAQIAGANLSLEEKNVEIDARIATLRREVDSLRHAGDGKATLSYTVLRAKHELDVSVLASKRAQGETQALTKSIKMLDTTIADYERLLKTIQGSPYMLAANTNTTVAFVPYDNAANVREGALVYGCKAAFVACKRVGTVAAAIAGEVTSKHPLHNQDIRGTMVTLALDDAESAKHLVLHVGRKPLFL